MSVLTETCACGSEYAGEAAHVKAWRDHHAGCLTCIPELVDTIDRIRSVLATQGDVNEAFKNTLDTHRDRIAALTDRVLDLALAMGDEQ